MGVKQKYGDPFIKQCTLEVLLFSKLTSVTLGFRCIYSDGRSSYFTRRFILNLLVGTNDPVDHFFKIILKIFCVKQERDEIKDCGITYFRIVFQYRYKGLCFIIMPKNGNVCTQIYPWRRGDGGGGC